MGTFSELTLKEGEYAVFSVYNCQYGYPELTLKGTSGDVIDLVAGTELAKGYVLPCKEETQFIADALIQSWTACGVYGDLGLSGKALEEFASSQFETGEMPAAAPSGIYLNIPDYARRNQ